MNIILLSGGSGKRLWPLSNEVRSKQFLKIFKKEDGSHESMIQRMYRMIKNVDPQANVIIATSENQVISIKSQLGEKVGISIEPCRRDTFPAIALATAYLQEVLKVRGEEPVIVCPVDPYVDLSYFELFKKLVDRVEEKTANLVLMGIEPTYPSTKYGYILPKEKSYFSVVSSFKEKPDVLTAEKYISMGALWNAGVFAFELNYVLDISKRVLGTNSYDEILRSYRRLERIAFDYAVVEKEKRIEVLRFTGEWKDLGTWNTITEAMSDEVSGRAVSYDCRNSHIINELQLPLIALGVENLAIVATPDGILVANKCASEKLKDLVPEQRPMFEKRGWGEYKVLDYRIQDNGQNSLTKHLIISEGQHISYQKHKYRSEMWTIVEGEGKLILDGVVTKVVRGDTAYIKPGMKHAIKADTELHIIEVQIGSELTEEDIERLDWDWSSIG